MSDQIAVKICGLTQADHIRAAAEAGARYVGFVFFPKSPRNIDPEAARLLAWAVRAGVDKVALVVDMDDDELDKLLDRVPIDILQLHGRETVERVAEIKKRYGLPVMKAVGVADAHDLAAIDAYSGVADQILVDAKPPKTAVLPGGNGLSFDWRLIAGRRWPTPWMLAGGLSVKNVAEAVRLTGARQVDVSSGVEATPGRKDKRLIEAFIAAAQQARQVTA